MTDPTTDVDHALWSAETQMRNAGQLFNDTDSATLIRVALETAPVLVQVARSVGESASHIVGCRFPEGEKVMEIQGVSYERSRPGPSRSGWDTDALLSAVLDSRLVDDKTGEVADESPLAKVLACWNLPAPRLGALKARGIDPDKFAHVTWPESHSWKVVPAVQKQRRKK